MAQVRIFRAGEFRAADRAFTAHSQPLKPPSDYRVDGGYWCAGRCVLVRGLGAAAAAADYALIFSGIDFKLRVLPRRGLRS